MSWATLSRSISSSVCATCSSIAAATSASSADMVRPTVSVRLRETMEEWTAHCMWAAATVTFFFRAFQTCNFSTTFPPPPSTQATIIHVRSVQVDILFMDISTQGRNTHRVINGDLARTLSLHTTSQRSQVSEV